VGKGYVPSVYCVLFAWLGGFSCEWEFCFYLGHVVSWVVMVYWVCFSLFFVCLYIVFGLEGGSCECT
jgi:uncharacterized membrane protein YagU involved in acid resistance